MKTKYYVNYYHENGGLYCGFDNGNSVADIERMLVNKKTVGGFPIAEIRCEIVRSKYVKSEIVQESGYVDEVIKYIKISQ